LKQLYNNASPALWQKIATEAKEHHDLDMGLDACEHLVFNTMDVALRDWAMTKLYDYMRPLPCKNKIWLNCPMGLDRVPNNPSIINTEDGYICNIRCSNYVYDPNFRFLDGGQVHLSDHVLIQFDPQMHVKHTMPLIDRTNNVYHDSFIKGFDDVRLITKNMFICSHGNMNKHRTIDQCLGTMTDDGVVTKLIQLVGPNAYRHEKNWLPLIKEDILYIIYTTHPFTLYQVDQTNGKMVLLKNEKLTDKNCDGFRGSSPPLKYKAGYLYTIHQVTKNLSYFHRFVWIDENLTTLKWSKPFYFETKGIEFNVGMGHSPEGLWLAHSVWDNDARMILIDYDIVDDYLKL